MPKIRFRSSADRIAAAGGPAVMAALITSAGFAATVPPADTWHDPLHRGRVVVRPTLRFALPTAPHERLSASADIEKARDSRPAKALIGNSPVSHVSYTLTHGRQSAATAELPGSRFTAIHVDGIADPAAAAGLVTLSKRKAALGQISERVEIAVAEPPAELVSSASAVSVPTGSPPRIGRPLVDRATWVSMTSRSDRDAMDGERSGALRVPEDATRPPVSAIDPSPATGDVGERRGAAELVARTAGPDAAEKAGIHDIGNGTRGTEFAVAVTVNGRAAGRMPLVIQDGANISVRLGTLLGVVQPMMESAVYRKLADSSAVDEFVTLNDLRAAGIPVRFGDDDRLVIGRR